MIDGRPVSVLSDGTAVWFDASDGSRLRSLDLGCDDVISVGSGRRARCGGVGDAAGHHARLGWRRRADQSVDPSTRRSGDAVARPRWPLRGDGRFRLGGTGNLVRADRRWRLRGVGRPSVRRRPRSPLRHPSTVTRGWYGCSIPRCRPATECSCTDSIVRTGPSRLPSGPRSRAASPATSMRAGDGWSWGIGSRSGVQDIPSGEVSLRLDLPPGGK